MYSAENSEDDLGLYRVTRAVIPIRYAGLICLTGYAVEYPQSFYSFAY